MSALARLMGNAGVPGPTGSRMAGLITPQQKIIDVNSRAGNPNIAKQQGTTFQIYDSILLDGRTELQFFLNANQRSFPLTNVNSGNGMLQAGESFTLMAAQLSFVTFDDDTGEVTAMSELDTNLNFLQAEFNLEHANQILCKNMKLSTWSSQYNEDAMFQGYNTFHFKTKIVVLPMVQIKCSIKLPVGITIPNTYAQLLLSGPGAILSAQQTF